MLSAIVVIVATVLTSFLLFSKKLKDSSFWRATMTPLASIMGSGFLVSAPLLANTVGNYAVLFMAILLLFAYGVGSVIRFNICHFEPVEQKKGPAQSIAFLSRMALSAAYFVSVTYYLQLLSAFLLQMFGIKEFSVVAPIITSCLLLVITGMGAWKGLSELEFLEKYTIALNLGMIGALLVALGIYNIELFFSGSWHLQEVSSEISLYDVRVLLGLLIVVQGFETSRYLGREHTSEERVASMRFAQLLSAGIYLVFLSLTTVLFQKGLDADVTAIIGMTAPVAAVLPLLLSISAMGSQFSAAVADTAGAGGLIEDLTRRKAPERYTYLLLLIATLALTWSTDVKQIIAYASRAFALYYSLQCAVALFLSYKESYSKGKKGLFLLLLLACLAVFFFGIPSE